MKFGEGVRIKMKYAKKLVLLFLTAMMVSTGWMVPEGMAATTEKSLPPAPTEGIASKDLINGSGSTLSNISDLGLNSFQYLMGGQSYIGSVSSTQISVSGNTKSFSTVDTIAVDLYLQRWDNAKSQWLDVSYIGEFKNTNSSIAQGSKNISISGGHYYRTSAKHWVSKGGATEKDISYSSYIYVQ